MRGRLAPSPTGALHLGNARSFLLAWLSARAQRGAVVLRMEDLDGPRVKADAAGGVLTDLEWLGLEWDEGPDRGGPHGPYVQTERAALYERALADLARAGLVYPCVCTRSDIERAASAPHVGEEGPRYPGTCRGRFDSEAAALAAAGRSPALRLRVEPGEVAFTDLNRGRSAIDVASQVGDFVVRKGNGTAAYQLAVAVDDTAMRITEVVRGDDLVASTPRQILIYRALGWSPPAFRHVPLVVGPDGLRLAKRHGDTRLASLRERGVRPERLVGFLAHSCGLAPPGSARMPADLISSFDWQRVSRAPVVCDAETVARLLG